MKGFVDGFATYDLINKRFRIYGYSYPFIEFLLGMAYLAQINIFIVNWITLIVMFVSGARVLRSMLSGQEPIK